MSVLGSQDGAPGVGSFREADSFIVHPNVLRNLPRGHADVIVGHPTRTISTIAVVPAPARPTGTEPPVDLTEPEHVYAPPAPATTTTAAPAPADEPNQNPADLDTFDDIPPAIEPQD
jgi:hypothetical protein